MTRPSPSLVVNTACDCYVVFELLEIGLTCAKLNVKKNTQFLTQLVKKEWLGIAWVKPVIIKNVPRRVA